MGTKITRIGITSNKISGRGGLPLFLRYVDKIGLYKLILATLLPLFKTNNKGLQLQQFLKQMFAFIMDGTHMSITCFDQTKKDEGYAALLESGVNEMASSHQINTTNAIFFILNISLLFVYLSCGSPLQ